MKEKSHMSRLMVNYREWRTIVTALFVGMVVLTTPHSAMSQRVASREEIAIVLPIEKIAVANGTVSGEIHNRGPYSVREVELLIRYIWLWDNEPNPGKIDPGTSTYHALTTEIRAGGNLPFTFTPSPPLPKVSGGRYEISVTVSGFAQVIPQTR
ncbi:MAG: hypothetical protein ACXWXT_00610 [Candidatus Binatia bacterium]